MTRGFLFLQGVCSPFFAQLGDALRTRGHRVFKMNFTAGDVLSWHGRSSWLYRGTADSIDEFVREKIETFDITDIVLFGDKRPIHRPAMDAARRAGLRIHVFEEGYFRPSWVTLERDGVNGDSRLPRDPQWYREVGPRIPDYGNGMPFSSPLWVRAGHDIAYHAASALNGLVVPHYRTHAPYSAAVEYLNYIKRASKVSRRKGPDAARIHALADSKQRFFLFPLQLNSDAQIRYHSRFGTMLAVMESVMQSFAAHAPPDVQLIIKNHPLDCGLDDYESAVRQCGKALGLEGRVHFLETGHLPTLLTHARGVVTVNSTVGGSALVHRCPVMALGHATYDMPGLTHQGDLESFWQGIPRPDAQLFRLFRNTVIHTTQINGGFYTREGIDMALATAVPRIEAERSELETLL